MFTPKISSIGNISLQNAVQIIYNSVDDSFLICELGTSSIIQLNSHESTDWQVVIGDRTEVGHSPHPQRQLTDPKSISFCAPHSLFICEAGPNGLKRFDLKSNVLENVSLWVDPTLRVSSMAQNSTIRLNDIFGVSCNSNSSILAVCHTVPSEILIIKLPELIIIDRIPMGANLQTFTCADFAQADLDTLYIGHESGLFSSQIDLHSASSSPSPMSPLESMDRVSLICGRSDNIVGYLDGPRFKALFQLISSVAINQNGTRIYMTDRGSSVRMLDMESDFVSTIAGDAIRSNRTKALMSYDSLKDYILVKPRSLCWTNQGKDLVVLGSGKISIIHGLEEEDGNEFLPRTISGNMFRTKIDHDENPRRKKGTDFVRGL